MNARALAVWAVAGVTVAVSVSNPVYRCLLILAALNLVLVAGRPGVARRPLLLTLLFAVGLATVLNAVLGHSGTHVLLRLPEAIPVLGGPLTLEGLYFGAGVGLGLAAAVLALAPLSLCLEPDQLVGALPPALGRTGAALGAALNLVPAVTRSVAAIGEAQRLRGLPPGLLGARAVLLPATLTALEDSLQLAESMEARAYGSGPRTSFTSAGWHPADTLLVLVSTAAALGFLGGHALGLIRDWYPYPSLTMPSVSLLGVVLVLLLSLPALQWRSSN